MITVYFCHGKDLYDVISLFKFNSNFNWSDSGLKLLLIDYYKVIELECSVAEAVTHLKRWGGSTASKKIKRITLNNGDFFLVDDSFYLYFDNKLILAPEFISKRLIIDE